MTIKSDDDDGEGERRSRVENDSVPDGLTKTERKEGASSRWESGSTLTAAFRKRIRMAKGKKVVVFLRSCGGHKKRRMEREMREQAFFDPCFLRV